MVVDSVLMDVPLSMVMSCHVFVPTKPYHFQSVESQLERTFKITSFR